MRMSKIRHQYAILMSKIRHQYVILRVLKICAIYLLTRVGHLPGHQVDEESTSMWSKRLIFTLNIYCSL